MTVTDTGTVSHCHSVRVCLWLCHWHCQCRGSLWMCHRYDYNLRQTTANHRKPPKPPHKPPQTTTNGQITTNHRKPPQTTTNHHKSPQTTARIWDDDYSCAGKKQVLSLSKLWLLQSSQALSVEHDAFAISRNIPIVQILHIYDVSVVSCGDLRRLAL